MSRFETWLSHVSTIVVALSGIIYLWMKYFMETDDPFSVVNHPLQPAMLSIHIVTAPLLVFVLGLIINSHIKKKLSTPSSHNRRSGLVSLIAFPTMVVSGYMLQVVSTPILSQAALGFHLVSSGLFALTYIVHQMFSLRTQAVLKAAGLITLILSLMTIGFSQGAPVEVTRQVHLMGTTATLTTHADDRLAGMNQLEDFLRILEETEDELSTWRGQSTISRLNSHGVGQPFFVGNGLARLFEDLLFWNRETNGAFDPAIGRLTDAWDVHGSGRVPTDGELEHAIHRSGMKYLQLDVEKQQLLKLRNITIDVGAFGKGEGLDRVLEYSANRPSTPFLINLGGQVLVGGDAARLWQIDLAHPLHRQHGAVTIQLKSGSVSTSAGSERDVHAGGRRIGHHLDASTGMPVVSDDSVSVWHPRALVADMLSTALFVMGRDAGIRWAEKHKIAATFFTPSPGGSLDVRSTTEWERMFSRTLSH